MIKTSERPRRLNRQLPKRFRDIPPESLPPLPPLVRVVDDAVSLPQPRAGPSSSQPVTSGSFLRKIFRTPRNTFGLVRQYFSETLPSHDPEEYLELQDLSDEPVPVVLPTAQSLSDVKILFPYPNRSSFFLGDWYWNHGAQKSRDSFRRLISIVGNPEFRPKDIQCANWDKINMKLGSNDFDHEADADVGAEEWMDEDAGWRRTPVSIAVPFHNRTKAPGTKEYLAGDLYHRSLVAVIREKLANAADTRNFHYEPFQLFWNPSNGVTHDADVGVHGEMYTSPAFLDAHRALQESSGEPGCSLPRVVVALMFWSDATHLTTFGTAKLWPCYMYFGNESKYNRCKPSCHLCHHVAYFQAVSPNLSPTMIVPPHM
jgi:hypothetical protein